MIFRSVAALSLMASLLCPAAAREIVSIGTLRLTENGALFIAAARGYFKDEGLDVEMTAYPSDEAVANAAAAAATDFGLARFTPAAFNYAGRGLIKAVAAQVREKRDYEGNEIVASNAAYAEGVRQLADLNNTSVAITQIGTAFHYQLGRIAQFKHFDLDSITLKPLHSLDAVARAVGTNQVEAAVMPASYARELLGANQAKLIGWYSEIDEQQLGALFVSANAIAMKRTVVEKFVRAYRRGAADYATLVHLDFHSKRVSNAKTHELATIIARYVYPGHAAGSAAAAIEAGAYYMDPQARLDFADIERQVEWYKAQGLIDKSVDAHEVVDLSFLN
jgi:NitT/TauT family transport system substrate-binding protein